MADTSRTHNVEVANQQPGRLPSHLWFGMHVPDRSRAMVGAVGLHAALVSTVQRCSGLRSWTRHAGGAGCFEFHTVRVANIPAVGHAPGSVVVDASPEDVAAALRSPAQLPDIGVIVLGTWPTYERAKEVALLLSGMPDGLSERQIAKLWSTKVRPDTQRQPYAITPLELCEIAALFIDQVRGSVLRD